MPSFKFVLFALPLLVSQALPSVASTVPRFPIIQRGLSSRQTGTCRPGQHFCSDGGGGCCPDTYYCDGGGCCPNGKTCSGSSGQCAAAGYYPCPGRNFCCPFGSTCGANSCFEGGGPAPAPTTHTRTTTIHFTSTTRPAPPPPPPTKTQTVKSSTVKSTTVVVTDPADSFDTATATVTDTFVNTATLSSSRSQSTIAAQASGSAPSIDPPVASTNGAPARMQTTALLVMAGIAGIAVAL